MKELADLTSVGPAMLRAFDQLGVKSVAQLAREDAHELYTRLCDLRREKIDPCCLDVFRCAVEQARNPDLPPAKRNWWYWSRVRKSRANGQARDFCGAGALARARPPGRAS